MSAFDKKLPLTAVSSPEQTPCATVRKKAGRPASASEVMMAKLALYVPLKAKPGKTARSRRSFDRRFRSSRKNLEPWTGTPSKVRRGSMQSSIPSIARRIDRRTLMARWLQRWWKRRANSSLNRRKSTSSRSSRRSRQAFLQQGRCWMPDAGPGCGPCTPGNQALRKRISSNRLPKLAARRLVAAFHPFLTLGGWVPLQTRSDQWTGRLRW